MANRTFTNIQSIHKEMKVLAGRFDVNGVTTPDGVKGLGFSIARTGVGIFTVTPKYTDPNGISKSDAYPHYLSFVANGGVAVTSTLDASTGVGTITATAGEPADNTQISFIYVVQNSSVPAV
jgi:hypothetical protein